MKRKSFLCVLTVVLLSILCCPIAANAVRQAGGSSVFYGTLWSMVPPATAILLALITKEVYSSLFVGIFMGGMFYSGFSLEGAMNHVFEEGLVKVITTADNVAILIFVILLGVVVCLMNRAGGSEAFGRWASTHIKSRVGAELATILLGVLIFVDDNFNCLTIGSVMRPVTDRHRVSREKLAYLIDSTAAPVCIIAPISSWAAAVTGFVEGENGFYIFLRAIPYNFYALLTIVMMVGLVVMKIDYGPMKHYELEAMAKGISQKQEAQKRDAADRQASVLDLVVPVGALIVCCTMGLLYTGGFFRGVGLIDAFSHSDAPLGLVYGSFGAFLITVAFYSLRGVLRFKECMECVPQGFQIMVPAILILSLAWTLKAMTDSLGAAPFVEALVAGSSVDLASLLPAVMFLIGALMAFATGTSWGTFGILIPIAVGVFSETDTQMMIISISACMAGAVCGDHCSPISDTTIMSSAGAQCDHVNHVSTQLPYAVTVAAVSFVTYLVAGYVKTAWIALPAGIALMLTVLLVIRRSLHSARHPVTEKAAG